MRYEEKITRELEEYAREYARDRVLHDPTDHELLSAVAERYADENHGAIVGIPARRAARIIKAYDEINDLI